MLSSFCDFCDVNLELFSLLLKRDFLSLTSLKLLKINQVMILKSKSFSLVKQKIITSFGSFMIFFLDPFQ